MKTPLCSLLLLVFLCPPGRSDCQGECLSCGILLPQQQAFNTLVCLLECEAPGSAPSLTWELCRRALELPPQRSLPPAGGAVAKRTGEELVDLAPVDLESDLLYSAALENFQQAGGDLERRGAQYDSSQLGLSEEGEEGLGLEEERDDTADSQGGGGGGGGDDATTPLDLAKRFGGFLKGRYGYKRLQKRYGGFLGIRKSARKWSNQKRVGQLLRQYLEMSSRSGRLGSRRQSQL